MASSVAEDQLDDAQFKALEKEKQELIQQQKTAERRHQGHDAGDEEAFRVGWLVEQYG